MPQSHLTDERLQIIAADADEMKREEQNHLASCVKCKNSVVIYTALFTQIEKETIELPSQLPEKVTFRLSDAENLKKDGLKV